MQKQKDIILRYLFRRLPVVSFLTPFFLIPPVGPRGPVDALVPSAHFAKLKVQPSLHTTQIQCLL